MRLCGLASGAVCVTKTLPSVDIAGLFRETFGYIHWRVAKNSRFTEIVVTGLYLFSQLVIVRVPCLLCLSICHVFMR